MVTNPKPQIIIMVVINIQLIYNQDKKRMQQQNNFKPNQASEPQYIDISPKHTPTWDNPLPPIPKLSQNPTHRSNQLKHF
mmetsp:Transcript_35611/g.38583  ORF Transcript_35611/g.38583 Transcript_35611/m.38583 type:complete len:80 (+) Transcript_35611:124-363(+)